MSHFKKIEKKLCALALTGVMTVSLAACGSGESSGNANGEAVGTNLPEYTYVPEYIQIDGSENMSFYNSQLIGDKLYYTSYDWNEETGASSQSIHEYSLTDKKELRSVTICENTPDSTVSKSVNEFNVMDDGGIVTIESSYDYTNENNPIRNSMICRYDADYNKVSEVNIGEASGKSMDELYVNSFSVDDQDRIYLFSDGIVFLFDSDLSYKGSIDASGSYFYTTGVGKDGKVYASTWDDSAQGQVLKEVDFDTKSIGKTYGNFSSNGGGSSLTRGVEGDFLINDGTKVYEYSLDTESATELFTWLDSDIFGDYVQQMSVTDDGRIAVCMSDWSTGESEIAFLTKVKTSELEQKTQITIGSIHDMQSMLSAAVAFNKQSTKYHINVKYYRDLNDYSENSYSDALTAMNKDLISDTCPDLVEISSINVTQLASKGVFEDLNTWLDSSSVISKSDYYENVIDGATYDGCLVYIPRSFNIQTVVGKTSDVGEKRGWSIDDIIALSREHPDSAVFYGTTKDTMLYYCMAYNQDKFIDYETGKCNFESDDFKKILEFVAGFPDEYDWSAEDDSLPTKLSDGRVLLNTVYLSDIESIQIDEAMFNAPVTYIGYPTTDGSVGCLLGSDGGYAITSKSKNKEGAWEFIEFYLTREENMFSYGFPTNKADMQELIDEALNVEYLTDENGELVLDEEGNPISMNGHGGIGYGDWEYMYHDSTQEEVDLLLDIISEAVSTSSVDNQITSIITEEAAPYFAGQKTVDDVAGVIQSRIQIYINENQ